MPPSETADGYVIWGVDHAVYGPVELPALVNWIKDERVTADTWIFLERNNCWEKAAHVPELQMFFRGHVPTHGPSDTLVIDRDSGQLGAAALRHVRIFAGLNDGQLEQMLQFMEVQTVPANTQVAKQGEPADAMFILLEGTLRIRAVVEGRETSLGSLNAGEFFGEISLFDHGTRCADLIATQDSTLLKIAASEFERFTHEKPDLAAPFLFALAKTLAARIRSETKRYRDSISYIRPSGR
jgi:hypothetical protein